jgi:two-component system KDP operon response regulator KdpE
VSQADILVVDDDPDIRLALQIQLKANGYNVHSAANGRGAISESRRHRPDLIILDLGIPDGDGFVVLDTLKSNFNLSSVPVLVLSGRDRGVNEERALNAGARAFLQKPMQPAEFLAIIQQTLDEKHKKPRAAYDSNDCGNLRV